MTDLNAVNLGNVPYPESENRRGASDVQRTKVPFVDKSWTTTEFEFPPSHRMMQCLLPKNTTRHKRQNARANDRRRRSIDALILIPGKRIALS